MRAIVLAGAGRAFSAGFDLDMEACGDGKPDPAAVRARARRTTSGIIMRFWDCPKPTLAAVHGYCLGSAMELALACDLTIAAEDCRFGAPEVKFGSGIVAMLLPWLAGPKRAKYLLLTRRRPRDRGAGAGRWGSSIASCPPARALDEALALAQRIAANDAHAVQADQAGDQPQPRHRAACARRCCQALELDVHDRDVRDRRIARIQRDPETGRRQGRDRVAQRARRQRTTGARP